LSSVRAGYATTNDGVELYYRLVGSGPPMVCCNGVGVSTYFWKYIVEAFADHYTILLWDYRAHGRSSLPTRDADYTVTRAALDLQTVMDQAGITAPAHILGHSMGVLVQLAFYERWPERVRTMVPMFGTPGRLLDTFLDSSLSPAGFRVVRQLSKLAGPTVRQLLRALYDSPITFPVAAATGMVDPLYTGSVDFKKYLEHLADMDPARFLETVWQAGQVNYEPLLADVSVPTLIFGAERDTFTPFHRSKYMADHIPGAELVRLPHASHAAIVEQQEYINFRLNRFFQRVDGTMSKND